jgi:hypothetical protein
MNESWKNTHGAFRSESLGIYEIIHDWPLWGLEASGPHNLPFRAITYTGMTKGAALSKGCDRHCSKFNYYFN